MEDASTKGDNPPSSHCCQDEEANSVEEDQVLNGVEPQFEKKSILVKFQEASREAKTPVQGTKNVAAIILDTFGDITSLLLHNVVAVTALVVGIIYFDRDKHCKAANIGLLLIVGGCITLVRGVVVLCIKKRSSNFHEAHPADTLQSSLRVVAGLLALAGLVTSIACWVIVFPLYNQVNYEDTSSEHYCNKFLYQFTFAIMLVPFVIIGLLTLMLCFIGCCVLVVAAVTATKD